MGYQVYNLTVAAGVSEVIAVTAGGVSCISSNLEFFNIGIDDGALTRFERGFSFEPAGGFTQLRVSNPNAVSLTVKIAAYSGGFVDRRFLTNEPQGIQPVSLSDIQATCFYGKVVQSAVAAQYSHVQLWNPAGSGKILTVKHIEFYAFANIVIFFGANATQLTTLDSSPQPKYFGGPAAKAELRKQSSAGILLSPSPWARNVVANESSTVKLIDPVVLTAGSGLIVYGGTVNTTISVSFEYLEIDG